MCCATTWHPQEESTENIVYQPYTKTAGGYRNSSQWYSTSKLSLMVLVAFCFLFFPQQVSRFSYCGFVKNDCNARMRIHYIFAFCDGHCVRLGDHRVINSCSVMAHVTQANPSLQFSQLQWCTVTFCSTNNMIPLLLCHVQLCEGCVRRCQTKTLSNQEKQQIKYQTLTQ